MRAVLILRLHTNTAAVQLTNSTSPHWVLKSSHQGPLFPTAPASQVYLSLKLNQALSVNHLMNVCCASARAMLLLVCVDVNRSPLAQMEEERKDHVVKMNKMEVEMEQVFEMKVKEKIQKLRDSETEVPPAVTNN